VDAELFKLAIQQHKAVRFAYIDAKGDTTERTVIPYRVVKASDERIYLHAYCGLRRAKRTFHLGRMHDLRVGEQEVPAEWYAELCPDLLQHNVCGIVLAQVTA
jgi:predicted DNA-binding transcriptional regulator YafY